jgi:prophage antirepressor-like protein
MRAEKKTFDVVTIDGTKAVFKYRQIDHAGEPWLSLDDVKYALESESILAGSRAAESAWYQVTKELEENPDEYFDCDVEDGGTYKLRRFVNELGIARVVWAYPNSESAKRVRQHFRKLLKAERERKRGEVVTTHGPAGIADVISKNLAPYFGHINHRMEQIEYAMPTMRDQDEFITARSGIFEQGRDPSMMGPKGRRNLEEWVGAHLSQNGADKGPKSIVRLGGQSIDVSVNTYRRKDIYRAIEVALSGLGGE